MSGDPRREWGDAWSLSFTLVGLVGIFAGLGYLVDRWVGTRPWLMVAGVFVGAIFGFVYLVSLLFARPGDSRGQEKTGTEDDEGSGPGSTRDGGAGDGGPDGESQ
jgi:F0F1-type ATP synthase assembly protein I